MERAFPALPIDPHDEELARDWTLSADDFVEVRRCRGDDMRVSFALQLCVVRLYGRFLDDDYTAVPVRILNHIGRQLGLPPVLFAAPPSRKQTDARHEVRIRAYLGLTTFDGTDATFARWLRDRAAEGLLVDELVVRAEHHLRERKVVVPATSTLERIVQSVASRTEGDKMRGLHARLPTALCTTIDSLLEVPPDRSSSPLEALRESLPGPTPDAMNRLLARAEDLQALDLGRIDLRDLPGITPRVVTHFADLVQRYDVAHLRRFAPSKRYAMLACFLLEREKTLLDNLVEMHHVYVLGLDRRARNAFRERFFGARRDLREHIGTLVSIAEAVRTGDATLTLDAFRKEHIDTEQLDAAITGCAVFERLEQQGVLDAQVARHSWLKQYLPRFLRLPFEGGAGTEPLRAAITHARAFHTGEVRVLGPDTPIAFATGAWRKAIAVTMAKDGPDARVWELALAFEIDAALRRGDLHLTRSREHVAFWNLVHSDERWKAQRERAYVELKLPTHADAALDNLSSSFDSAATAFLAGLGTNRFAAIEGDRLALSRRDALEVSKGVRELRHVIEAHMPEVGIEDLLVEVDRRCRFTRALTPLGAYTPRIANLYPALLAALVAQGTNLGVAQMAHAACLPVETLQYVSQWFLHDDALRAANKALVDYHHQLAISSAWGDGTFSSSDGQRFGVEASSLLAAFYPRYFGYYDRAVSVYTHVSDQHSVFSSRVISCAPREAIYVLDGLLENDTLLDPREHTTDTHGSTDQLFALCYLLGIAFMPRLADLGEQQLYKPVREHSHGALDPLLRSVDAAILREQWDAMVRIAVSLRDHSAQAHVIVDRLAASASDRPAKALTALGRVVKSTYLLRYMHEAPLRDRVHLQLNRGEARHIVAKRLFFGNQGVFRTGEVDEIMNKVSALSVLSNAVLVWNTVRVAEIVAQLESTSGRAVPRTDLARVSPLLTARLLVSGRYHFDDATSPDN